ncbi:MAG: tyrosine-type recombinase/integrase [Isosphaeraceae bacterium]
MPRSTPPPVPSYRRHRASNQAVVTLNGVDHYLGEWNSPESKARYDKVGGEWQVRGRRLADPAQGPDDLLLKEVILGYYNHTLASRPRVEVEKIKLALKPLRELCGESQASAFNAVAYQAIRAKLVQSGLCISTIRARLGVIKRMVSWAIAREMMPDRVRNLIDALEEAEPLRVGQAGVKPSKKVPPAPMEHVLAILPHVNPTIRAMIETQVFTGARPGEVCRMTTGQIDRTGEIWVYVPSKHKTAGLGKVREIAIGPRGQAVLKPWLKANPDAPMFSPVEAVERRNAERKASRATPSTPSSRARKRKARPKRAPRTWYDKNSYNTAIRRGCLAAGVPVFKPNMVRHTYATRVRREFGLEHAQVTLGHSRADVTQVYAESNRELAVEVARKLG